MPRLNTLSAHVLKAAVDEGITSPAELASLMGNAEVETAGFTTMRERLVYSDVSFVLRSSRSAATRYSRQEIEEAVQSKDPKRIATILYEGRNEGDLGNSEVGDGYRFHGRGHFQITGRYNYKKYGEKIGVDLLSDPERALDPEISAKLAVAYWKDRIPEKSREDVVVAGLKINGSTESSERRARSAAGWATLLTPELIQGIQSGSLGVNDLAVIGAEQVDVSKQSERSRVETLQQNLNRLGYVDAAGCELKVDGDYGRRTRLAVEEFQRSHGLAPDGIAGPLTMAAVQRAVETELRSIGQPDAPYLRSEQPVDALSAYRSLAPEPVPAPTMPVTRQEAVHRSNAAPDQEAGVPQRGMERRFGSAAVQAPARTAVVRSEVPAPALYDPRHPECSNHDLYNELKRRIPDASEDRLVQFTAACHESRITTTNLVAIRLDEDKGTLTFIGSGPLAMPAKIDLTIAPPRPEEAMEQIQQHDLQQAQLMEQVRAQQAQLGMGHAR